MCINYITHFEFCRHDGEIEHRLCGVFQPGPGHEQGSSVNIDNWCPTCWSNPGSLVRENIPNEFQELLPERKRYTNFLTALWARIMRSNETLLVFIRNGPTGVLTEDDRDWVADTYFKMQYDFVYRAITPGEENPTRNEIIVMFHFWKALELHRIAESEAEWPHSQARRIDILSWPVDPETLEAVDRICVICAGLDGSTDETGLARRMRELTCTHRFCNFCIYRLMEPSEALCPICRREFPTIQELDARQAADDAINGRNGAVYPNPLWWLNLMRFGVNP